MFLPHCRSPRRAANARWQFGWRLLAVGWLAATAVFGAVPPLKIRIGVESSSPPLSYVDEQGRLRGYSPDLLREVGRAANIEFEIVPSSWTWIGQEFNARRLDALANVAFTRPRAANMEFSVGHAALHALAYTRSADRPVRSIDGLAGKRIAVVGDSLTDLQAREVNGWGGTVIPCSSREATFDAVRSGACDVALHMRPGAKIGQATDGLRAEFVEDLVYRFRIAVHRGDSFTLQRLNDGLAEVIRNGKMDEIYARWIGPIEPRPIRFIDLRPYLWPTAAVAAALTAIFVWQQRMLAERKRIEGALRASEARYRSVLEAMAEGLVVQDADGRIIATNAAARRIEGRSSDDLIGRHSADETWGAIHEDGSPFPGEAHPAMVTLRTGQPQSDVIMGIRQPNGLRRWISINSQPIVPEPGAKPTAAVTTFHDITELKAHEREIHRLNRVYATISRVNYAMVQIRERDRLLREVCEILIREGGFRIAWVAWHDPATDDLRPLAVAGDRDNIISRIGATALPDRPGGQGPTAHCFRAGEVYVCNDFQADPVTLPWREEARQAGLLSSISLPIRVEGVVTGVLAVYAGEVGFFGRVEQGLLGETANDLSYALTVLEREQRRHRSEVMLTGVLDAIPQSVFWKDRQGVYLGCNAVFARGAGLARPEEIVGRTDFDLPWRPGQTEKFRADDAAVIASGEPKINLVEQIQLASGEERWLSTSKVPLRDPAGQIYGLLGVFDDITERLQTENALRESRAQALAVMNSTNDLIWSVDPVNFALVTYNQAFADYFAGERGLQLRPGLGPEDLVPPAFAVRWREFYGRALREGRFTEEYRTVTGQRTLSVSFSTVRHLDKVVGISVFGRDISQLIAAEAKVRLSEHELREAQRAAQAGSWQLAIATGQIVWTERLYEVFGLPASNPPPTFPELERYCTADSWQILNEHFQHLIATGEARETELEVIRPDGSRRWLLVRGEASYDEQRRPVSIHGMAQDITSLKATAARLRLQSAALEATANAVIITSAQGDIIWINPAFTRLTGYDSAEVVGRNPRLLKSGSQPDEFYAGMWRQIAAGQSWSGELVNLHKDGRRITVESTITPVRSETGQITHFVAVQQDITERRLLEKQVYETQRLESIGLLASGIAHDLNNIIAPISLSMELLRTKYPNEQRSLEIVEQCARRGASIVRQVLAFSRGMDGTRVPLPLSRLVKEMIHLMAETLPRNIELTSDLEALQERVRVDPTQIHQVLLNLAVNARDAMPNGGRLGFRLTAETLDEAAARRIVGARPGHYLALEVSDTGTGIAPDILPRIFEPFFSTKPRGQGTGLGLSTVHGIVRSHGGFIQVESQVGRGTIFRVYLPVDAQPENTALGQSAHPFVAGQGRYILVADDEETIRNVTQEVLERRGFVALLAADGQQAIELFRANRGRIKAALLDRMMPGVSGENVAQMIHRLEPSLPIILCTGLVAEGDAAEQEAKLKPFGIAALLGKPFTEDKLLRIIGKFL
ncbi:MAG: PAS domain S-box protein [Verrucomicrobia bacterium]|nr:PAS domain S-box protein [Verrucomicrobiota bacterium]